MVKSKFPIQKSVKHETSLVQFILYSYLELNFMQRTTKQTVLQHTYNFKLNAIRFILAFVHRSLVVRKMELNVLKRKKKNHRQRETVHTAIWILDTVCSVYTLQCALCALCVQCVQWQYRIEQHQRIGNSQVQATIFKKTKKRIAEEKKNPISYSVRCPVGLFNNNNNKLGT